MPTPPELIETPAGDLALPFLGVATALSGSATFRTMVGAADAAAALEFIDYPLRDIEQYGWPIPGAIVTDDDSLQQQRKRLPVVRSGQLLLILCDEMKTKYYGDGVSIDYRNDDVAMRNRFGAILAEILVQTPYLAITNWRKVGTPTHLGPPDWSRDDNTKPKWFRYGAFVIDWV